MRPTVYWSGTATRHLRADCPRCLCYLKFLPKTPENVRLAEVQADDGETTPPLFD